MEKEDKGKLYAKLMDEACDYVSGGLTLKEFYTKHEKDQAKRNLLIKHSMAFHNLWKHFELLHERKKQKYSLGEAL